MINFETNKNKFNMKNQRNHVTNTVQYVYTLEAIVIAEAITIADY